MWPVLHFRFRIEVPEGFVGGLEKDSEIAIVGWFEGVFVCEGKGKENCWNFSLLKKNIRLRKKKKF